jgi:hypothetical protein
MNPTLLVASAGFQILADLLLMVSCIAALKRSTAR